MCLMLIVDVWGGMINLNLWNCKHYQKSTTVLLFKQHSVEESNTTTIFILMDASENDIHSASSKTNFCVYIPEYWCIPQNNDNCEDEHSNCNNVILNKYISHNWSR